MKETRLPVAFQFKNAIMPIQCRQIAASASVQWAFQEYATGEWALTPLTDALYKRGLICRPIKSSATCMTTTSVKFISARRK